MSIQNVIIIARPRHGLKATRASDRMSAPSLTVTWLRRKSAIEATGRIRSPVRSRFASARIIELATTSKPSSALATWRQM